MTDDKKKPDDVEGIDWDSALDEWESKTFVPEVAKDTTTDKPATLAGNAPHPSKALYRAPTPAAGMPPSSGPRSQKPTLSEYTHEPAIEDYVPEDEDDDGSGATVIAAIPRELLRGAGKAEESGPKSVGGGLGQLFSKTGENRIVEGGEGIDVDVAEQPIGKVTSRPPPMTATHEEGDPSIITSAKHLGVELKEKKPAEPLRRPSQIDPEERVREGEMFDPFEEPDTAIREPKGASARGVPRPAASPAAPKVRPQPPPRPMALTPAVDFSERDPFAVAPRNPESDPFGPPLKVDASADAPPLGSGSVEVSMIDTAESRAATAAASTDEALDALLGGGDDDDDEPPSDGPALLAPHDRKYDPNEETSILAQAAVKEQIAAQRRGSRPSAAEIDLVNVGDVDDDQDDDAEEDDEATRVRMRGEVPIDVLPVRRWPDEKPAAEWLDGSMRAGLLSRADWLEAEARATSDKGTRARGLLAVSELRAIAGDTEAAAALAIEARDLAPTVVLSHRQARALLAEPRDPGDVVAALDLELKHSPSPAARVHVALLAADAQRLAGDDDGAAKRFEQAFRIAPSDPRSPLLRAARALSKGETASAALRLPDAPEMSTIATAVASALRLRGVDRADPNAKKSAPMTSASQEVTQAQLPDSLPNDSLRRARTALDKGDVVAAAALVAELRIVPELARGAAWLAAALGATRIASRTDAAELLDTLAGDDGDLARRALAARAIEIGTGPLAEKAIGRDKTFSPAERAVITTLVRPDAPADEGDLEALVAADGMRPLAAALSAITPALRGTASPDAAIRARAARTAGTTSHGQVRLARLIASHAPDADIEAAVASFGESAPPEARAIALELAIRGNRFGEVSDALGAWASSSDGPEAQRDRNLAAAIVAERAGDKVRALAAFKAARAADPAAEATLRAVAALDPSTDLTIELNTLADELGDGARGAVARLEAVARAESTEGGPALDDATRAELLERAHRAAPALPIASFLAERIARRAGDVDAVLRWVRERRAAVNDPLESGLDGVREALLVADKEPGVASERLEEAHRARPNDVALRELYERMSSEPLTDRGAWRESRASQSSGDTRALFYLEAAHEYERAGDREASLRASEAAATASGEGLGRVARERAEVEGGQVARLADELLGLAKSTEDPRTRREAYERLAVLDALGRDDPASAMLWHRSILEETPLHVPSLRYVEHVLIGEGRDDELETIASAIAKVLAPSNDTEAAAHAWLAARLRLRGATGDWESTRELVELAAAQPEPTLWALRMMQAHARAHADDTTFLAMTEKILERSTRPTELAVLLVRAGEAAARLEDLPRARELFERAAMEDPGDVVTWGQLADVRQRAGDARGAAEACESLARTSVVPEHQLLAWYDAGRFWLDEVKDDDRGVIALEQTAAIDVSFEDTFQRLSAQYAARKSSGELASLLERRIAKVTDPAERIGLLVDQGRVLTEVEDYAGARAAFESALEGKPDDPGALSALADLCAREKDWDAAEQAWVRLARLLPSPDEQRAVYARLGELYAKHAPNYARAEVALKEVLKRAPDDISTMEQLVEVYRHQNDSARAVELQQELITKATAPEDRRKRLIALSSIYESTGHENRKAEQALETARRELPTDVVVLRALVDFYTRHKQLPAVNILLDRVSSDARRAFAAGRFVPALFEVMQTVYDLRGKKDAARIVGATLAAFEGRSADIRGADARGLDPRLDDMLAPETLTPAFRALLARTGDALDAAMPLDLRSLKATALPPNAAHVGQLAGQIANAIGMGSVQVYVSPHVGTGCLPAGSAQPALVIGEGLLATDRVAARQFLIVRALKLVQARASALARLPSADLAVLIGAWLQIFNPTWKPQGINANALAEMGRRVQAALPRNLDADIGMMALEVSGSLGTSGGTYGATAVAWANRAALLVVGDPNAALDAIALSQGSARGAPSDPKERATWIGRTAEAKDIIAFSVSDAYGELRAKLGIGS